MKKVVTESGDKLKFEVLMMILMNLNFYYYDENFNTEQALNIIKVYLFIRFETKFHI